MQNPEQVNMPFPGGRAHRALQVSLAIFLCAISTMSFARAIPSWNTASQSSALDNSKSLSSCTSPSNVTLANTTISCTQPSSGQSPSNSSLPMGVGFPGSNPLPNLSLPQTTVSTVDNVSNVTLVQ